MPNPMVAVHPMPSVLPQDAPQVLADSPTVRLSDALDRLDGMVGLYRYDGQGTLEGTAPHHQDNLGMSVAVTLMQPGHVRLNVQVSVGGGCVNPGDVQVADDDGLVALPQDRVPTRIEGVLAKLRREQAIMAGIDRGAARQNGLHGTFRTLGLEM